MSQSQQIGRNLARLRREQGLSISALAERSGVAKSTLSSVEAGEANPTVDTLWAAATALGVPFGRLVEDADAASAAPAEVPSTVHDAGRVVRFVERVAGDPEVELFLLDLQADARRDADAHRPGVTERVIVLSGVLLVGPAAGPTLLRRGESLQFAADAPHVYAAQGGPAKALLWIEYPAQPESGAGAHASTADWPTGEAGWAALRLQVGQWLQAAAQGTAGCSLHLRGAPSGGASVGHLQPLLDEAARANPWPALAFADGGEPSPSLVALPLTASAAFAQAAVPPESTDGPWDAALRLAAWAEAPAQRLHAPEAAWASAWVAGECLLMGTLAADALHRRGQPCVAAAWPAAAADITAPAAALMRPGIARQVLALAQDLSDHAGVTRAPVLAAPDAAVDLREGIDLALLTSAAGPVVPDDLLCRMLAPLLPGWRCARVDALPAAPARLPRVVITGAVGCGPDASLLPQAFQLLRPGGVLVVAGDFVQADSAGAVTPAALVRHHLGHLVAAMAGMPAEPPAMAGAPGRLYRRLRSSVAAAMLAAEQGRAAEAVKTCRRAAADLSAGPAATGWLAWLLRYGALELQAVLDAVEGRAPQPPDPGRWRSLARLAGFRLLRQRRIFASAGDDDASGSGVHVLAFAKPEQDDAGR